MPGHPTDRDEVVEGVLTSLGAVLDVVQTRLICTVATADPATSLISLVSSGANARWHLEGLAHQLDRRPEKQGLTGTGLGTQYEMATGVVVRCM